MTAIDPHTHIYPGQFIADVRAGRFGRTASIETDEHGEWLITRGKVLGRDSELRNKLTPLYYELEPRFADMERMGVAHQVLSIGPAMTLYTLEAEANKELAASLNDGLTALAGEYPDKFSCMATAPLQDPEAAAVELERASANGHLGVMTPRTWRKKPRRSGAGRVLGQGGGARHARVRAPHERAGRRRPPPGFYLRNFIGNPLDTP